MDHELWCKNVEVEEDKAGNSTEERTGGAAGCRFPPPWGRRPAGYAASTPVAMPTEGGKRKVYADTPEKTKRGEEEKENNTSINENEGKKNATPVRFLRAAI